MVFTIFLYCESNNWFSISSARRLR